MKALLLVAVLLGLSAVSHADEKFGMAGCGLGSLAMGPTNAQVLASTTNATGFQGFAITSGTSNCMKENQYAAVQAQQQFFTSNLKTLSKEMAQGRGEYVNAFASTMGCKREAQDAFAAEMQKSYDYIFSAPGAMRMLKRVRSSIHENKDLNSNCDTVI